MDELNTRNPFKRSAIIIMEASLWHRLRGVGNSRLASLAILMPLLGYLIVFNSHVISFLSTHVDFCVDRCDISSKIIMFYFGSFFIGLGSMMFTAFCPEEVRAHAGPSAFFEAESKFYAHPKHLMKMIQEVEESKGTIEDTFHLKKLCERGGAIGTGEIHVLSGLMSDLYIARDASHPSARLITATLYGVGFILTGAPSLMTFFDITRVVIRRLF